MKRLLINAINRLTSPRAAWKQLPRAQAAAPSVLWLSNSSREFQQIPLPCQLGSALRQQLLGDSAPCRVSGRGNSGGGIHSLIQPFVTSQVPLGCSACSAVALSPLQVGPALKQGLDPSLQSENPIFWEIFPSQVPSPALKRTETYESLGSSR